MYLVNTSTLKLQEFIDGQIPPYAILSHRWGTEELTFKEVSKNRADKLKNGCLKMEAACHIALCAHGLQYLWVDTCCIDKRSSAELSEAINSMYRWYEKARVCIAYLWDVEHDSASLVERGPDSQPQIDTTAFVRSEWFSRAWTLQELLAPDTVCFYDRSWVPIGTKESLKLSISKVTNLPESALTKQKPWSRYPIAQRMSWASHRRATREEDLAYSLLGVFDVKMPMLYGEGKAAFVRLQEVIISTTTDRSFLLWGIDLNRRELLADSPADFFETPKSIERSNNELDDTFALNNTGLSIEVGIFRSDVFAEYHYLIARGDGHPHEYHYTLVLRKDLRTGHFWKVGISSQLISTSNPPLYMSRAGEVDLLYLARRITICRQPQLPFQEVRYNGLHRQRRSLAITSVLHGRQTSNHLHEPALDPDPDSSVISRCFPAPNDISRLVYKRPNNRTILLDIFFDFDCRPCTYVSSEGPCPEGQDVVRGLIMGYGSLVSLSWQEASIYDKMEQAMVREHTTGTEGWILRSGRYDSLRAWLPECFSGPNDPPYSFWFGTQDHTLGKSSFWEVSLRACRSG